MKGILFNTQMVQAILAGRKTQTRRVVKPQPIGFTGRKFIFADEECPKKWEQCDDFLSTAPYRPGHILYVRETWGIKTTLYSESIVYRADYSCREEWPEDVRWHPSIHMPKAVARIFLRVTDVRVERLWGISSEDVYAEGTDNRLWAATRDAFRRLWDSTIKKADLDRYGWCADPWVWVCTFERCAKDDNNG